MAIITLSRKEYRDKVYACWLGKNIGGTLGTPYETHKYMNNLDFYCPVPNEPLPNDDLDLQLVWLKVLEDNGPDFRLPDLAEAWKKYLPAYPWNEYGFCMRNLDRGLMPPVSGWFENYYVDEMGSPIRSEIWACIAPANPQRAAALSWNDSALDHAGGEGMWGEMFWAAVESAAFVISDPLTLIRIGLSMIPPSCSISRVIREAIWCSQNGKRWAEARDRIVKIYADDQPCNAIANHGFTILGWLYGEDFGDKLCKAVNCGYDTDCTGATLGSVLGIIGGTAGIPQRWSDPVGKTIVLHKFTGKFNAPTTIDDLTNRTVTLAEQFSDVCSEQVAFGTTTILPADVTSLLFRNEQAFAAQQQDVRTAVVADRDVEIIFNYQGDPVFYPGIARTVTVSCRKGGEKVHADIRITAPQGWAVAPREGCCCAMEITANAMNERNEVVVNAVIDGTTYQASFTVFSPEGTKGFPSAENIERCPVCGGRKET
ncbi:MAG TPA: ADP-ribosylglycohydrolase family protein, partial [Armatimonadota bacterium]|nr:ADP-ribosylglycohydrolase family protein [Armatimonadota bacterium]